MNHDEIDEAHRQFVVMWKAFVADHRGSDVGNFPGLHVFWADSPLKLWNALLLSDKTSDAGLLAAAVRRASDYMRAKTRNGSAWICLDYLTGEAATELPDIISACGLELASSLSSMVGGIFPLSLSSNPGLTFARVVDDDALATFADVDADAFGIPVDDMRAGLFGLGLWKETAYSYIGSDRSFQAVSVASVLVSEGQLYLALVGTRRAYRKLGYAEATVRHALQKAFEATGLKRTSLHATAAAAPIYARMGYHATSTFNAYRLIHSST
jgi:GNAT superfamily N-acetyltransferase